MNLDPNVDAPETTIEHAKVVREKRTLTALYDEFYTFFCNQISPYESEPILELGSGGGFAEEYFSSLITSDVIRIPYLKCVCSGTKLPFSQGSLRAIVMINVLHHIQDVALFFDEASRVLKDGGKIVMIEPTVTWWSYLFYRWFHHEPFDPAQQDWKLPEGGRLSQANDALPWIVFDRDRALFESQYPVFKICHKKNILPLRYLASGGYTFPSLLPKAMFPFLKWLEQKVPGFSSSCGLFSEIVLEKVVPRR